jgi:hypothetical protein
MNENISLVFGNFIEVILTLGGEAKSPPVL